ncbi:MAG: hypothetical protein HOE48_02300 [Candidatus Latescibacteria bacterium]|nr:hypothetical protein [Candidatus Latescibacterota bacterium]MBT4136712.1 hypothetical protein [Candidatus Latescibacterota bacterium]MBT5831421.1 hypothetical protein [Candidatus Latescibacterota bacterium]
MGYGDFNINLPDGENFAPESQRVLEVLDMLSLDRFHFGVPCTNRIEWDRVRNTPYGQRILAEAHEAVSLSPRPFVTNEIYESCWAKDSPTDMNAVAPLVRARMALLPLAECVAPTGEYLKTIEEDVRAVSELRSWVHPSNDNAQEIYSGKTFFADLVTFHIAANLTAADYLLGDRLAPEIRALIRSEVEWRVFEPFRERIESGKDVYWWVTVTHNWNSVCLAGLLSCALWLKEDASERAWYVALAEKLVVYSENGFTDSGFYTEGVSYWGYGFGHYVLLAEMLQSVTGGQINWLKRQQVERIAQFGARMEIQQGRYPTFSDCVRDFHAAPWLVNWMNNRVDDSRSGRLIEQPIDAFENIHFQFADQLLLILFHQVDVNKAFVGDFSGAVRDWFADVQFLICRPPKSSVQRLAATVKGGHNGANHNHNDVGTFTVLLGDQELLTDPGAEVYTNRTFSKDRYEGQLLNSFGHPVPVVAGQLQIPGEEAQAVVISESFQDEQDEIVLDLRAAYDVVGLEVLSRRFLYQRTDLGAVEIMDRVVFFEPNSFEIALITYAPWETDIDGNILVGAGDQVVNVQVDSVGGQLEFDHCIIEESATPARLAWRFRHPVRDAEITMRIVPCS